MILHSRKTVVPVLPSPAEATEAVNTLTRRTFHPVQLTKV